MLLIGNNISKPKKCQLGNKAAAITYFIDYK